MSWPAQQAPRAAHRLAMIVELQRDADHLRAGLRGERGRDRAVDAARHGDDDSGIARRAAKLKIDPHWKVYLAASLPEFHSSRLDRPQERRARGAGLARHERDFRANAEEPLSLDELLALLGPSAESDERVARGCDRLLPLGRATAGSDAVKRLGGAFAEEAAGLRERKDGLTGELTSAFQNVFNGARIKTAAQCQ